MAKRIGQASRLPGTREAASAVLAPDPLCLEMQGPAEGGQPLAWPSLGLAVQAVGTDPAGPVG